MQELIDLVATNGIAITIIIYFLFKDYKFNDQIIGVLSEIKEVLAVLKEKEDVN